MFNWFNNLKIRNKLIGAFMVIIALLIIVSVIALSTQNYTQATITKVIDVENKILRLSLQSQNAMLMARRHEKDYLLRYKQLGFEEARAKYVTKVQTQVATILKYMDEIKQLETDPAEIATVETIKQAIAEYKTTFLAVVDLLEKRGFKDSGLEGQFRQDVHAIEKAVKVQNLDQLTIEMLTMRRHEKDYLLRADEKYIHRLHETVAQFKVNVAATDLSIAEKEQLTTLANQYQAKFDQLVQIDTQIVASIKNYRAAVHRLKPLLERIHTNAMANEIEAQADIQRVAQTARLSVISASVVAVLVGFLIAYFLAGLISKPLTLIVQGSQLLSAGNTALTGIDQAEIAKITTRRDEMGDIGRAFDALASYFKEVIADIVKVSQGLAEGNLHTMPMAEYRGDFVQIKQALETALSNQRLVIEDIVHVSQGLAEGDLSIRPQSEYRGDFVHIKSAQETALSNQKQVIQDIVQVSQGLATGNLQVTSQTQYRGDFVQIKDALEVALTNLREVIDDIVQVSQGLAEGEQRIMPQAEYRGEFAQIKNALETAATKLAETTAQNSKQDWLKTGQAQLNDLMSGELDIVILAKKIISFLTIYIEAQVGLFYVLTESKPNNQDTYLQMIASHAYTANDNRPQKFFVGEGLVGHVAMEQKTLFLTQTPEECASIIRSGLANALPRYVLLIPFLYENAVKGVIEIGFSEALTDDSPREFLEQIMSSIGIAMNTAESRTQMQTLLEQSQMQTEELQSQSEELQAQQEELQHSNEELQSQREELENKQAELQQRNEELQSQAEELQSQSEELQTQQEELKQTNEALEERTKDLEQQKEEIQHKNLALEKTQTDMTRAKTAIEEKAQELELASKYKSEFLANMSHELRTPLNSLLILAQLLADNKQGNLTDKQVEYAQTVHSAGSDLLTLINDILDLSKVEAGKMEVHVEDLSLADLVETIEQKFRYLASEKGLAFHITVADDLPPVLNTDVQRLKQIINNLLSNAFKFTEKGEIKLSMQYPDSHEEVSIMGLEPGKTIAIRVTDTGIGIPKDKQQLIFEAFQQVDGTTSRRYGGTGLGLSISRQLARLLGGELKLESEEGKGSTFTLYLPEGVPSKQPAKASIPWPTEVEPLGGAAKASIPSRPAGIEPLGSAPTEASIPSKPTGIEPLDGTPVADDRNRLQSTDKSILIIEDDRKFSGILMDLAREKGFKCIVAEDGRMGLQFAEQYQPNAIILDVGLPQLDGWTVMEKLKDNADTRHIPVHFISATDHHNLEAKKMGAIGYLHKPVNMEQLGEAFNLIEHFQANTMKNLLVVVDSEPHQQKMLDLVGGGDVQITQATTTATALQHLKAASFDCIILDMDIEQRSGTQLLEQMQEIEGVCQTPVITYTDRELTPAEEALLLQCADELPVKSVSSPERLLDEATLFLHQIEANLPSVKRKMLKMVHDKEAILTNKKVLIADDDIRNTFALTTVLEDKNMEVVVANHGKEALELLEEHPDIAIVLMDIMMPEMDGYEAMRQIRVQQRYRKLPIIALTAKAMKGDKAKCIEAGANDYLSKPVETDKLISLMRVWLYR
jgi:signal transduction histidine kinase/DNA-binding response OmpR family regulator/CHASE3 domain sensor protein/F0F1-type ATP synthase assembly protein I